MKSTGEHGTLYQLRNKLNRTNVVVKPVKDFNACDDFFIQVVSSHIVAAALEILDIHDPKDSSISLSDEIKNAWMLEKQDREVLLKRVSKKIVDTCVSFKFNETNNSVDDHIFQYAQQILSLGLFYFEFSDAIREGDGERVLRCWKYLLPIFLGTNRTNYSTEAFNLLFQHKYALSPRLARELLYTRFINTHGRPGKNIPADLHMEHLNKIAKDAIRGLGSNKSEKAIVRVGRALGTLSLIHI